MSENALGAQLRQTRLAAEIKPSVVCELAGLPNVQTLTAFEKGTRLPSETQLLALARVYGVSPKPLFEALDALQTVTKSQIDYVRQLVDAATALNLSIAIRQDPYNEKKTRYLNLDCVEIRDFYAFVDKWATISQLYNDGIISKDEYRRVVTMRLEELNG